MNKIYLGMGIMLGAIIYGKVSYAYGYAKGYLSKKDKTIIDV